MNKLLPWSHSKLEVFEQCPKKAYHTFVLGEKENFDTPAIKAGKDAHKALENYLLYSSPLPQHMAQSQGLADSFKTKEAAGHSLVVEKKLALNADYTPHPDYFAKTVYARGAADVIVLNKDGESAFVGDFKTGKRREKEEQLQRLSIFIFSHYPTVNKINAANIWLSENMPGTKYTFTRDQLPEYKAEVEKILESAERAEEKDEWVEKPGPLCGFCHIHGCRFNKARQ